MKWFWDNVYLKKEERTSTLIFLCALGVLMLVKLYLVKMYEPPGYEWDETVLNVDFVEVDNPIDRTENMDNKPEENSIYNSDKSIVMPTAEKTTQRFSFDPNLLSMDSLLLLGIGKYAVSNIIKYRSKGGKFYKDDDLSKIYGIDKHVLSELIPLVKIENIRDHSPSNANRNKSLNIEVASKVEEWKNEKEIVSIDINRADTTAFKKLHGIGTVYANRIVKFRNSLGGFFTVEQIADVWGISDSLYTAIRPYLTLDTSYLKKVNINELEKDVLIKHPYIDWKKAKHIINYRKMHGKYLSIEDLRKLHGLENDFVDTLKFYFVAQ